MEEVEDLVSPRDACDVAGAEKGESALLFLARDESGKWVIQNSGRGRMPQCSVGDKQCVKYFDVIFPVETITLDTADPDSVFNGAVELATVRDIVTKSLKQER